jgi:hypothetical protein
LGAAITFTYTCCITVPAYEVADLPVYCLRRHPLHSAVPAELPKFKMKACTEDELYNIFAALYTCMDCSSQSHSMIETHHDAMVPYAQSASGVCTMRQLPATCLKQHVQDAAIANSAEQNVLQII